MPQEIHQAADEIAEGKRSEPIHSYNIKRKNNISKATFSYIFFFVIRCLILNFLFSGRVKKLKLLKSVIPLLIAAKAKIGALATVAYFFIALVAKKAIVASLISIAISAFIGLKYLWSSKSGSSFTPYNSGWNGGVSNIGGWSAPVSSGGWATSGSGSWDDGHYAQNQAYSSYHHRR